MKKKIEELSEKDKEQVESIKQKIMGELNRLSPVMKKSKAEEIKTGQKKSTEKVASKADFSRYMVR